MTMIIMITMMTIFITMMITTMIAIQMRAMRMLTMIVIMIVAMVVVMRHGIRLRLSVWDSSAAQSYAVCTCIGPASGP